MRTDLVQKGKIANENKGEQTRIDNRCQIAKKYDTSVNIFT